MCLHSLSIQRVKRALTLTCYCLVQHLSEPSVESDEIRNDVTQAAKKMDELQLGDGLQEDGNSAGKRDTENDVSVMINEVSSVFFPITSHDAIDSKVCRPVTKEITWIYRGYIISYERTWSLSQLITEETREIVEQLVIFIMEDTF